MIRGNFYFLGGDFDNVLKGIVGVFIEKKLFLVVVSFVVVVYLILIFINNVLLICG